MVVYEEADGRVEVVGVDQVSVDIRVRFDHLEGGGDDDAAEAVEEVAMLSQVCHVLFVHIRQAVERDAAVVQIAEQGD